MELMDILTDAVARGTSDILIIAGLPVSYKINGVICREGARLLPADTAALTEALYRMAGNRDLSRLTDRGDDDFSFALPDRVALGIPDNVMAFSRCTRGMVLFTGPAGSGKTTTLACIVDAVNTSRNAHVITIEDPIEYLHQHKQSVVTQRELFTDTASYDAALRAALREAPDIILLGEMRDPETIKAAVTAAETGHLVISTLHTIGAANTIDRIVDSFPPEQQGQIRTQLALVLEGVVSQELLPRNGGGLVPAFEVMTVTPAVRNMIRESKAHQLDNVIAQSAADGMTTLDQSILKLVKAGTVTPEEAVHHALNHEWMLKRLSAENLIAR